jgi:hypothetical protein
MDKDMTIYRAFLAARSCAESLHTAHDVEAHRTYHVNYAISEAKKMAALLGYELVEADQKREAA